MKMSEIKPGDIVAFETDFQVCIVIIKEVANIDRIETDAFRMTENNMCSLWKSYVLIWDNIDLKNINDKNIDSFISSLDVYYPLSQIKNKKRALICIFKAEE